MLDQGVAREQAFLWRQSGCAARVWRRMRRRPKAANACAEKVGDNYGLECVAY